MQNEIPHVFCIPDDVVNVIFTYVTNPSTYKEILHINTYFHAKHISRKDGYCNQLWTFIKKHPELCVQTRAVDEPPVSYWSCILANPNTTLNMIEFSGIPTESIMSCYWNHLAANPNITIEFINKYPPPFPDEDLTNENKLQVLFDQRKKVVIWEFLSRHKNITIKDIDNNPSYPWRWEWVLCNPNVTYHDIDVRFANDPIFMETARNYYGSKREINKLVGTINNMTGTYRSPPNSTTIKGLISNPNKIDNVTKNEWGLLSSDEDLTFDFIEKYIDKSWSWDLVFSNRFGK
jgi:hypothetical protein